MTALLFSLGIILVCVTLMFIVCRHMVNTMMKMYDNLIDNYLDNYGITNNKEDKE